MKRKVCVVITARPSYSRVKSVLEAINKHPNLELQLVVSASALLDRYGKVVNQIQQDGLKIAMEVYNLIEGETRVTAAKTTGLGIIELASALDVLNPDVVVSIADRYETIATAIAASYMNIPLAHLQGGEVTGNIDEKVRHAVTKLADIHFTATQQARERVIRMGEAPEKVFLTGCPSMDIARNVVSAPADSIFDPLERYAGVGSLLPLRNEYIIVMQHSVTTEAGCEEKQIFETYYAVKDLGIQIYWFWPNVDTGSDLVSKTIRKIRETDDPPNIYFFKNLSPEDFILLLYRAKCIVGNSSVAIREASFLGVPAVNIGTRQSGRERGDNVTDVDYSHDHIQTAIRDILSGKTTCLPDSLYGDGYSGERIADLLAHTQLTYSKRLQY